MGVAAEKNTVSGDMKLKSSAFSKREPSKSSFFQPRTVPAEMDDVHESGADTVANKVLIQPKCAACEDEEKLQRKENGEGDQQPEAQALVGRALSSPGAPLDATTSAFMQGRFGYDFSGVKIHTGAVAAKSAEAINALAYTSGDNVVFGRGQYQPATSTGKKLLAHELTHVLQQRTVVAPKIQREEAVSEHSKSALNFGAPFKQDVYADTSTGNQTSGNNYWYQKIRTVYELDLTAIDGVTTDGMNMLFAKAWEVRPMSTPSNAAAPAITRTAILPLQQIMPRAAKFFYCTFTYSFDAARSKAAVRINVIESALQGAGKVDLTVTNNAVKVPKKLEKVMDTVAGTAFPGNDPKAYFKAHPEVRESVSKYLQIKFSAYEKSKAAGDFSLKEVVRLMENSASGSTEIQLLLEAQGSKDAGIYFVALYYSSAAGNTATPDYNKKDYIDHVIEKDQSANPTAADKLGTITGLDAISNSNEKLIVKSTAYQLFKSESTKTGVATKNFRDTEVDQIIPISQTPNDPTKTEFFYYTFIIHKADASNVINITVKRIGKKGDAVVGDPSKPLIARVPGYAENAFDANQSETPDKLKKWIRARYKGVAEADITAATVADMTTKINTIIETKAKTPEWFKDNYGIVVLAGTPGATRLKNIHKLTDAEVVGTKDYSADELNFIELALQRFSNNLLPRLKKVNLIRQVKNLSPTYGDISGLTQQPYTYNGAKNITVLNTTITMYDTAFTNSTTFMGGVESVNPDGTESITHEFGHVVAYTFPGMNVGNTQYVTTFNKFYKSLSLTPVTKYAKDTSSATHSPDTEYFPEALMLFMTDPEWLVNNQHQTFLWFLYLQENGSPPSKDQATSLIKVWEAQQTSLGVNPGSGDSTILYALWKAYAAQKAKVPDDVHIATLITIPGEYQNVKKKSIRRDEINSVVTKWLAFVKTNKTQPASADMSAFF